MRGRAEDIYPGSKKQLQMGKAVKKRTGVERINGRVDRDYKFEKLTIRGIKK